MFLSFTTMTYGMFLINGTCVTSALLKHAHYVPHPSSFRKASSFMQDNIAGAEILLHMSLFVQMKLSYFDGNVNHIFHDYVNRHILKFAECNLVLV